MFDRAIYISYAARDDRVDLVSVPRARVYDLSRGRAIIKNDRRLPHQRWIMLVRSLEIYIRLYTYIMHAYNTYTHTMFGCVYASCTVLVRRNAIIFQVPRRYKLVRLYYTTCARVYFD